MSAPDPIPDRNAARRDADRRVLSRVLVPALAVSVLAHIVALNIFHFHTPTQEELPPPPARLVRIVPAMQAFHIAVTDVEVPAIEVQVRRPPALPEADVPPIPGGQVIDIVPTSPQGNAGVAVEPGTGADPDPTGRLRYRGPTREVWRRSEAPVRTTEEIVRERVASQLNAFNDSMAAEAGAAARATDWTVKDGQGGRWGVSPGQIHLGSVTLPLPFQFSTPPGRRDEVMGKLANWNAIQQQASYVEGRELIKDRVKAMEARKAAEREERLKGKTTTTTGSGGSTTPGSGGGGGPGGS